MQFLTARFHRISFLASAGIIAASFIVAFNILDVQANEPQKEGLISPLPFHFDNFRMVGNQKQFQPNIENPYKDVGINELLLTSRAALSYDLATNRLLYSENITDPIPMASLTKIMTAILVIEHSSPDELYTVSEKAAAIGENSMGLSAGEKHKVQDLLHGLILPSGNDAAEVLAEGSPFGREHFVYQMNKKAEDIGLLNTRFTNPSGLSGDGSQFTTVYDLLLLSEYAMRNEEFRNIVSTVEHHIPYTQYHKEYFLYNDTNLLTSYPGVKGIKTGFTDEAGMCLVTYLEYGEHRIIGIVMNSSNRRQEMKDLLDYSLSELGVDPPDHS